MHDLAELARWPWLTAIGWLAIVVNGLVIVAALLRYWRHSHRPRRQASIGKPT